MAWSWAGAAQGASRGARTVLDMLAQAEEQQRLADEQQYQRTRQEGADTRAGEQHRLDLIRGLADFTESGGRVREGTQQTPLPTGPVGPMMTVPVPKVREASIVDLMEGDKSALTVNPQLSSSAIARREDRQREQTIAERLAAMTDNPQAQAALGAGASPSQVSALMPPPPKPPAEITPYQQEQLRLAQERLALQQRAAGQPSAAQQGTEANRSFQREQSLQSDIANDPTIKTAKAYASAFQGVVAAAQRNDPQSNLALMYEAVKMRDPNAVREGELALQARARSIPEWLRGMWARASRGNILTDTERAQIVDWAAEKIRQQRAVVDPILQRGGEAARRFGADSAYVAPDPFAGIRLPGGGDLFKRYGLTPPPTGGRGGR